MFKESPIGRLHSQGDFALRHRLGGISLHHDSGRDGTSHHAPGCHYRATADRNPRKDDYARADVDLIFNADRGHIRISASTIIVVVTNDDRTDADEAVFADRDQLGVGCFDDGIRAYKRPLADPDPPLAMEPDPYAQPSECVSGKVLEETYLEVVQHSDHTRTARSGNRRY